MLYLYLILFFLFLVLLALIIYLITKLKKSTTTHSSSPIWSGKCDNRNFECDANNNCSISCMNKIVFSSQNVCSELVSSCNHTNDCSIFCSKPPNPIINCQNGFGIWQGKCSSIPSATISNRNVTVKCNDEEIVSRALCDDTSIKCIGENCAVCCKVNDPPPEPPPPTCQEGASQIWPRFGADKCPFIETKTENETSKLFCSGKEVFSGQCGELSTICTNGKCIGCCTAGTVKSPPVCQIGTEVWRTDDPTSCSSINTSCENGTCIATCNSKQVYKDSSGYTKIASRCNNVGCVVCAIN